MVNRRTTGEFRPDDDRTSVCSVVDGAVFGLRVTVTLPDPLPEEGETMNQLGFDPVTVAVQLTGPVPLLCVIVTS